MSFLKGVTENKKSILIIEDEQETVTLLSSYMEMRGFKVAVAKDGLEGIKMVKKKLPDLVLLDIMLPGMSGFDLLVQIKNDPATREIPVLMCSAMNGIGDIEQCSEWGASGYITKPFDLKRVLEKINSVLGVNG